MPDPVPDWLATMRGLDGTKWAQGDGPNQTIKSWLSFIGTTYPNMAAYCNAAASEEYFSWCGLTVGYCMAKSKIAPVFGATDVAQFLFATAWLGWGTPVTTPQLGDVLIFNFGGGDHHVTLFEKDNGDGTYSCHGGNQSHEVMLTNFRKSNLMGIRRPNAAGAAQPVAAAGTLAPGSEGRAVTALQSALAAQGFDPGGIDGEFGPLTSAAVSDFQHARSLAGHRHRRCRNVECSVTIPGWCTAAPVPEEPPVQIQDILKTVVDALITKQQGTTPSTTPPATVAPAPVDATQLLQIAIAALAGQPLPGAATATGTAMGAATAAGAGTVTTGGATTVTTPPVLSVIDQLLGGQALAGKKTMLAVIAYVILAILEATGTVQSDGTGGQIATTLIGAFGALGGLAKVDRLTQVLGLVANQAAPPAAK